MATTREDVIPTLEKMPLFRGLTRQELETIAAEFDDATYLADHGIITEGMEGPEFFVILEGRASVLIDGRRHWFVAHLVARSRWWTSAFVALAMCGGAFVLAHTIGKCESGPASL